jgi:nucleoside triphosphatase YtkD
VIEHFPEVVWGEVRARFIADAAPPSNLQADTVLVFVFYELKFLLANIVNRGWSIPGGRIEANETPEAAAHREVFEETGARLDALHEIGYYILTDSSDEVESTRLVTVYNAHASSLQTVPAGYESTGVMLVSLTRMAEVYYMWDMLIEKVFSYAHSRCLPLGWSSIT